MLRRFYDTMKAMGADVVYGLQAEREGGLFKRFSGDAF